MKNKKSDLEINLIDKIKLKRKKYEINIKEIERLQKTESIYIDQDIEIEICGDEQINFRYKKLYYEYYISEGLFSIGDLYIKDLENCLIILNYVKNNKKSLKEKNKIYDSECLIIDKLEDENYNLNSEIKKLEYDLNNIPITLRKNNLKKILKSGITLIKENSKIVIKYADNDYVIYTINSSKSSMDIEKFIENFKDYELSLNDKRKQKFKKIL